MLRQACREMGFTSRQLVRKSFDFAGEGFRFSFRRGDSFGCLAICGHGRFMIADERIDCRVQCVDRCGECHGFTQVRWNDFERVREGLFGRRGRSRRFKFGLASGIETRGRDAQFGIQFLDFGLQRNEIGRRRQTLDLILHALQFSCKFCGSARWWREGL